MNFPFLISIEIEITFYYFSINSTISDNQRKSESANWILRSRNTFTLFKDYKLQIAVNYNSKTVNALGVESDNYGFDLY